MMQLIPMNQKLRCTPSKMLNLLSSLRLLNSLKICIQTKVLKTMVSSSSCVTLDLKILLPAKYSTKVTASWYTAWPVIIFHILIVISGADFGSGSRWRILFVGASVARARAARVSMIRLTQSSWTAVKTLWFELFDAAETNVRMTAVMLTVI